MATPKRRFFVCRLPQSENGTSTDEGEGQNSTSSGLAENIPLDCNLQQHFQSKFMLN